MTHADSEARKSTAALRLGVIRVVVVAADRADWRSEDGPPPVAVETTAGLARLGDPVELIRADSAASLAACCTDGSVDLVLLDRLGETRTAGLLAALPVQAPPTVVVVGEGEEDEALAAFRVGAADCIAFGPDYEAVLPVVLLEQVRRSRSARRQRAAEDRIRWLEDLYAAVVTEMPAALAVLDADGLVVAANPEFDLLFPCEEAIPTSASGGRPRSSWRRGCPRSWSKRSSAARGRSTGARTTRSSSSVSRRGAPRRAPTRSGSGGSAMPDGCCCWSPT
ncbi:MAG: hypothetical protein R3E53_14175 [Myxococcota bacterium]